MDINRVACLLERVGLILRGGFRPRPDDEVPCPPTVRAPGTVMLAGNAGDAMWSAFRRAGISRTHPHPLNEWTREVLTAIAEQCGAHAVFPFDGPPYLPFLRWAQRAEPVTPSPIGTLIHPTYGLWHAYRGALIFPERLDVPSPPSAAAVSPCRSCKSKPCLTACPVDAFGAGGLNVAACLGHLGGDAGKACLLQACLARGACPVGRDYAYSTDQAMFHMKAFLRHAAP